VLPFGTWAILSRDARVALSFMRLAEALRARDAAVHHGERVLVPRGLLLVALGCDEPAESQVYASAVHLRGPRGLRGDRLRPRDRVGEVNFLL
jgi:hypothetical protein